MGFFSELFQSKPDYPAVVPDTPLAAQLQAVEEPLQSLLSTVRDRLEIVPLRERSILIIGKPPKGRFGVAWIENGEVRNFQSLAREQGVSTAELNKIGEKFRAAYEHSLSTQRFTATVAGRDVVVTPDQHLGKEIEAVIHSTLN